MTARFTASVKSMLLDLLDYLAEQEHHEAIEAIMAKLAISTGEREEWQSGRFLAGGKGLKAKWVHPVGLRAEMGRNA